MPIRIAIAGDHVVLRRGLRVLLELEDDLEVVGEAPNGAEAIELAERKQPDILLLDLMTPALRGVGAIPQIRKVSPTTKILVLTMHGDVAYLRQVLRLGAKGYVVKIVAHAELVSTIVRSAAESNTSSRPFQRKPCPACSGRAKRVPDPTSPGAHDTCCTQVGRRYTSKNP